MSSSTNSPWLIKPKPQQDFTVSHNKGIFSNDTEEILPVINALVGAEVSGFILAGYKSCPSLNTDDFLFICSSKEKADTLISFFEATPIKLNLKEVSITITNVNSIKVCTMNNCGVDCIPITEVGDVLTSYVPKTNIFNVTIVKTNDPIISGRYTIDVVSGNNAFSAPMTPNATFKLIFKQDQALYLNRKIVNVNGEELSTDFNIFTSDNSSYIANVKNLDEGVELDFGSLFYFEKEDGTEESISGIEGLRNVKFSITEDVVVGEEIDMFDGPINTNIETFKYKIIENVSSATKSKLQMTLILPFCVSCDVSNLDTSYVTTDNYKLQFDGLKLTYSSGNVSQPIPIISYGLSYQVEFTKNTPFGNVFSTKLQQQIAIADDIKTVRFLVEKTRITLLPRD
jgi:hypothetical protein